MPEQDLFLRSRQVSIIFAEDILQLARVIQSETKSLIPKRESMCLGMRHGYQWEIATRAISAEQCDVGRKFYMNPSCRYSCLSAILCHSSFVLLGFSVVCAVRGVDGVFLCTLYGACRVALRFSLFQYCVTGTETVTPGNGIRYTN